MMVDGRTEGIVHLDIFWTILLISMERVGGRRCPRLVQTGTSTVAAESNAFRSTSLVALIHTSGRTGFTGADFGWFSRV